MPIRDNIVMLHHFLPVNSKNYEWETYSQYKPHIECSKNNRGRQENKDLFLSLLNLNMFLTVTLL